MRNGNLATTVAAAGLVLAPALMKVGGARGGQLTTAAIGDDLSQRCVTGAPAGVLRRAGSADSPLATLASGVEVEVLSESGEWSHVSYSRNGRVRHGWVKSSSLGSCNPPPSPGVPGGDQGPNEGEPNAPGEMDTFNGCPLEGDAKQALALSLNPLKNRYTLPDHLNPAVTLSAVLKPGDDSARWNTHDAAELTGFVFDVKVGGVETCNCHDKDPADRDTHIELVLGPNDSEPSRRVIVEVTPRLRAVMQERGVDWSTSTLQTSIKGKWVRVQGWLFFDAEHTDASENTNPGGASNWRATGWELHPVTSIQVVPHP